MLALLLSPSLEDAVEEPDALPVENAILSVEDAALPLYDSPPPIQNRPLFLTFIVYLISEFSRQCLPYTTQFGALILVPQNQASLGHMTYQPSELNGSPQINAEYNMYPFRNNYGNYIVARPEEGEHAEAQLLQELSYLWTAFLSQHNNQLPEMIVLYSWIIPCDECVTRIVNTLAEAPYNQVDIYVIYTTNTGNAGDMRILQLRGIGTYRQCFNRAPDKLSDVKAASLTTCDECGVHGTFQYCLLTCAKSTLASCVNSQDQDKAVASFINQMMAGCYQQLETIQQCGIAWMDSNLGRACSSLGAGLSTAKSKLMECIATCSTDKYFSSPLDVSNLQRFPGILKQAKDLKVYTEPGSIGCAEFRMTSTLCSKWKDTYLTAGKSVCKSSCSRIDQYYSWCSVEQPHCNDWEYCCTQACGKHDKSYNWCYASHPLRNYWDYCTPGDVYSTKTVAGVECHRFSPCGQHGCKQYYWCYTDTAKNWNYCCRPDHPCGKHEYSYNWCYYDKDNHWRECTP